MRTVTATLVLLGLVACGPTPKASVPDGGQGVQQEPGAAATGMHDLKPLRLGVSMLDARQNGPDTAFVTCGAAGRRAAEAAVIRSTARGRLALPDTGCLIWLVLKGYATSPAYVRADSLQRMADTAYVFARRDVSQGRHDAPMRPIAVLHAPSGVSHVRLVLQTDEGWKKIP